MTERLYRAATDNVLSFAEVAALKNHVRGAAIHQGRDTRVPPHDAVIGPAGRHDLRDTLSRHFQLLLYFDDKSIALFSFDDVLSSSELDEVYRSVVSKEMPNPYDAKSRIVLSTVPKPDALLDKLSGERVRLEEPKGTRPFNGILKGRGIGR